jgi:hypothetical protein
VKEHAHNEVSYANEPGGITYGQDHSVHVDKLTASSAMNTAAHPVDGPPPPSMGRGPGGHVRNVKAMNSHKLLREYGLVLRETPRDEEVVHAWRQEIDRRSVEDVWGID